MQADNIIILDSNKDNTQFFSDQFLSENYEVEIVRNLNDISAKIADEKFKLVMIDYLTIISSDRADVIDMFKMVSEHQLVVYNVPDLANRRLAFYDLGALRVYDESLSLNEIFLSLKWLLKTMDGNESPDDYYSVGKLEDIPLATLIKIFGKENRTGVLKVLTTLNSGKIYFANGDVDQAQVGFHTGDRAVLHMLFWKSGSFSFTSMKIEKPVRDINLSNIGLLLLAERLRKEYIVHLEEIGPPSSVLRIKNLGDLLAYGTSVNQAFLRHIERPHMLEELIENQHYTSFETAETLVQLKRQGFIIASEPTKGMIDLAEPDVEQELRPIEKVELSAEESEKLLSILQLEGKTSVKLMIFGSHSSGKTRFVNALSNSKKAVKSEQDLDLGHLEINSGIDIFLLGIRISEKAIETIQKLSEGVSAYIFLIEGNNEELFEYTNYLINYLTGLNEVPWTVAVTGVDDMNKIESIKKVYNFPMPVEFLHCDTHNVQSIKDTLLSLQWYQPPEEEEEDKDDAEDEVTVL